MSDDGPHGGAMTRKDYEKIRKSDDERIRSELGEETEAQRQKRLWAEENARRRGDLG